MRFLLSLIFVSFFGSYSLAKNCSFNSWDVAYGHIININPLVNVKAVEPTLLGVQQVTCPDLERFVGSYSSVDNQCAETTIAILKDKLSLSAKGLRSFVGINAGVYGVSYAPEGHGELETKLVGNKITEKWTLDEGKQVVSSYELSLVSEGNLQIKITGLNTEKICKYSKR